LSNISLALMNNCSLAYFIILLTLFRWVLYLRRRKGELFCFTCLWSRSLRDRPFNLKWGLNIPQTFLHCKNWTLVST
jgi:hypothetical protein